MYSIKQMQEDLNYLVQTDYFKRKTESIPVDEIEDLINAISSFNFSTEYDAIFKNDVCSCIIDSKYGKVEIGFNVSDKNMPIQEIKTIAFAITFTKLYSNILENKAEENSTQMPKDKPKQTADKQQDPILDVTSAFFQALYKSICVDAAQSHNDQNTVISKSDNMQSEDAASVKPSEEHTKDDIFGLEAISKVLQNIVADDDDMELLTMSEALHLLEDGESLSRDSWINLDKYIIVNDTLEQSVKFYDRNDNQIKPKVGPMIFLIEDGVAKPYVLSNEDLFAKDWIVVSQY